MTKSYTSSSRWQWGWMSIPFVLVLLVMALPARAQEGSQGNATIFNGAQMTFFGNHNFLTGGGGTQPGIVGTLRSAPFGVLNFASTASSHVGANDANHIDGYVRKLGTGPFIFPTGDNGHYGPFGAAADGTTGAYFFTNASTAITSNLGGGNYAALPAGAPFNVATKAAELTTVSPVEYWDIDGANATAITLTWSASSAIGTLTTNDLSLLTIAGWNGTQWVRIPSTVDVTSVLGGASGLTGGSITSTATLTPDTYTAYTFAAFVPVVTQPTFACQAGIGYVIGNRASGGADTFISDLYQYNLNTGSATLVKANITEETTNRFVNALGYNSVDNYLWGFRIGTNQLVRIGSDYSTQLFNVTSLTATDYATGDISSTGIYYGYSGGASITKIDLNPASVDYLKAIYLPTTVSAINDWAFSPIDNNIYAMATDRSLYRFNAVTGARTLLGVVTGGGIATEVGAFGTAFMDDAGNFYVGNNSSGKVFKINQVHLGTVTASLFSSGTSISPGDGARCPFSPVAPVATNDVASTTAGVGVGINVLANDTPGSVALDPTKVKLIDPTTSQPVTTLTVAGEGSYSVDPVTGLVTFTPLPTFSGVATPVKYTVTDVNGLTSNQATITVTVTAAPPSSTPNPDVNATYVNVPVPGNVGTNDNVPTGTTYGTPTASIGNPSGGSISLTPDGVYSFTGTTPGSYTFTVPVCAPGQTTACPTQPLVITVKPNPGSNTPAPPVANTDITSVQGSPTTPASVTLNVRANDGPGNTGGSLGTPTITTPPAHGTASVDPNGNVVYTPTPGYYGDDILTYQVCESPSGQCTTAQEVIHILPPGGVNTTLAADDYVATSAGTPVSGNVKLNDTDSEGNTQTVSPQTTTTPAGSLTLNSDGSYTFIPASGVSGPVSFTYTTCDNGNPQACTKATLYILVAPGVPDLTPILYVLPATQYGTTNFTAVVDVYNLLPSATTGLITVYVSKESLVALSFNGASTFLGGKLVQNGIWTFDGTSNPNAYIFTTTEVIGGGSKKSFGLTGVLTPGNTKGTLTISTTIVGGSGGEVRIDNNSDAEKIDYFNK